MIDLFYFINVLLLYLASSSLSLLPSPPHSPSFSQVIHFYFPDFFLSVDFYPFLSCYFLTLTQCDEQMWWMNRSNVPRWQWCPDLQSPLQDASLFKSTAWLYLYAQEDGWEIACKTGNESVLLPLAPHWQTWGLASRAMVKAGQRDEERMESLQNTFPQQRRMSDGGKKIFLWTCFGSWV